MSNRLNSPEIDALYDAVRNPPPRRREVLAWWLAFAWLLLLLLPAGLNLYAETLARAPTAATHLLAKSLIESNAGLSGLIALMISVFLLALLRRPWLWVTLHLPFLLWLPVELYYQWRYLEPTSAHIIAVLRETNPDEIVGYLGMWIWSALAAGVMWVTFLFGSIAVIARHARPWSEPTRSWAMLACGGMLLALGLKVQLTKLDVMPEGISPAEDCIAGHCVGHIGLLLLAQSYPWGMPVRLLEYHQQQITLAERAVVLRRDVTVRSRPEGLANEREVYVLVLGESARADRWQLMGYTRATNPRLSARANVVPFTDVVTATVATRTSVPILLSSSDVGDLSQFNLKSSWIPTFQAAGFHVTWLSTQMPVGTHDTTIGIYAALADTVRFVNLGNYRARGAVDGALLAPLEQALAQGHEKHLIVLHTLGSHAPYARRYPTEFEHFEPSLGQERRWAIVESNRLDLIDNAYDNSVRYTDWLLDEVIRRIDDDEALAALWYVSDHGVTLLSDGCDNQGNGFLSRANLHVPALFWFNQRYASGPLADAAKAAQGARQQALYTGTFSETLLQTFGFELPHAEAAQSWLAPERAQQPRLVTVDGKVISDYDALFTESACMAR